MLSNILDRIAFWSLFLVVTLLPIFFIPFTKIPAEASKSLLVVAGLAISVIAWSAARFTDGKILIPKSKTLLGGGAITLATLLSAFFSDNRASSFFGTMFDVGSFWFIFVSFLIMLFLGFVVRTKEQAKVFLLGTIASLFVLLFFQTLRYLSPSFLSFGILSGKTANLFGSWSAFGYIAGLSVIIIVSLLESISVSKKLRIFLYTTLVLSLFTVIAVNSAAVWEMVGIFSLFIFIYKLASATRSDDGGRFPVTAFTIVVISLLFFLSGRFIGGALPSAIGLSNIEISPSLSTTFSVGKSSLTQDPLFGVGPNRFGEIWALWKPQIINNTKFWDTAFSSGFGFLPTAAINTGLIGILSWLFFVGLVVFFGIKSLLENLQSKDNYLAVLYFIASLFMLVACFLYSFGITGVMFTFALIGLFIAATTAGKENGFYEFNFLNDPRKSFISILLLVAVMLGTAGVTFKFIERFASVPYFNKTLSATNAKSAESNITKAISLHQNDLYFRTLAQVELANLTILSQKQDLTNEDKFELQSSFDKAVSAANSAISYDNKNYVNYQMLGVVYSTAARLGVEGAGDKAIESYISASKLNKLNPGLKLSVASEYSLAGNSAQARKYAEESLSLAPNYIDALVLISQIEKSAGNTTKAGEYAFRALSLDPSNKTLIDYAESFKYTPPAPAPEKSESKKKE